MTYSERAERKAAGLCTTSGCTEPAGSDNCRCDYHAELHREHCRRSAEQVRELRRDNGLCADCARPSKTYRCEGGCPADLRKLQGP